MNELISTPAVTRETIAFVIPLYNEEAVVSLLIEEVEAYRAAHPEVVRIILVDDGSDDATVARVQALTAGKPGYRLVRFSRNFGHQLAVTAGLGFVDTDAAVILDADLQDPLHVVTQMLEKWREGYDVVYGVRRERQGETVFKRATASLFYRIFRWGAELDVPLDTGDFRLIGRPVIDAYNQITEQEPFTRGLVAWLGFKQVGIEYERAPRAAGTTKYNLKRMLRLALTSLTSFSDKPLKLSVRLGMFFSLLSVLGLIRVFLVKYFYKTAVTGWASLMVSLFFFSGLILFFLGMIGTYLSRVYEEVKGRPRYVIEEVWSSVHGDTPESPIATDTISEHMRLRQLVATLRAENASLRARMAASAADGMTPRSSEQDQAEP